MTVGIISPGSKVVLVVPDRLTVPLSESFPPVAVRSGVDSRGLLMPADPVVYTLEVGPAMLRARRSTTAPASDWSDCDGAAALAAEDDREHQGLLEFSGLDDPEPDDLPVRVISEWSRASRRNMTLVFATLDWWPLVQAGIPDMLTLTYPGDWRRWAPDGPTCRKHLEALRMRLTRRFGAPPVAVWKREFQARGAPHFHLYFARPAGISDVEFRRWVSNAWYEIVGSGDLRHLRAGTGVDRQFVARAVDIRRLVAYFAKHSLKESGAKEYQNVVPEGFELPGRFWGVWGLKPDTETLRLARSDYHQVVRILRRLQRAARPNGRRSRAQGGELGLWTLAHSGRRCAVQIARWLRGRDPCDSARWYVAEVGQSFASIMADARATGRLRASVTAREAFDALPGRPYVRLVALP